MFWFGQEIDVYGVAKVVISDKLEFAKGDLVVGLISWGEYTKIGSSGMIRKLDPMGFPLSNHVGILGKDGFVSSIGGDSSSRRLSDAGYNSRRV